MLTLMREDLLELRVSSYRGYGFPYLTVMSEDLLELKFLTGGMALPTSL